MKRATSFALVLVTAPDLKTARRLAQCALRARLIACANLVPKVESHYWWQGKLESGAEVLLILKTRRANLRKLEALVLAGHPYDTPEFIVLGLHSGSEKYLAWLAGSCATEKAKLQTPSSKLQRSSKQQSSITGRTG